MADAYYKPCKEFDICNELIEKYWETKRYDKCFEGHLVLAEQGYPLAECHIGLAVPQSMVIEIDNTIWQSFMKMQSEWNEISNRLSIGIDLLHCKTMIWQSRNAKNLELHCNYASQYNQQFVNFQFGEGGIEAETTHLHRNRPEILLCLRGVQGTRLRSSGHKPRCRG